MAHCPCDGPTPQTGLYITFTCTLYNAQRNRLLARRGTWEEPGTPNEIQVDINRYEDGVIIFFSYLFDYLT